MTVFDALHIVGACITFGLGLLGLVQPRAAARLTSITPRGETGLSEIRATYGGFFLLAGAYALWSLDPPALTLLGLAWIGAAIGRTVSIIADRSRDAKNFGSVVFEAGVGIMLLV